MSGDGTMDMPMPMSPPYMNNSMNMNMNMKTMMHMSFYWGKDAIIIFSGWPNQSLPMYILAFFFVLLLAFSIEILSRSPPVKPTTSPVATGLAHASVHALRMGLAYLVMLAVMSFNVGIFIAAVIGHGLGFFVLRARALSLANQTEPKV